MLRAIEQRLEKAFEGIFGRAFRTNVQPVELARKLAKEMDEHRSTSVTRIYVPNEYTIYLATADRQQFEGYESSLASELEEYLTEHAARENYALLTPPRVTFETDDDLGVGVFGIATRMTEDGGRGGAAEPLAEVAAGATMLYTPSMQPSEPEPPEEVAVGQEVGVLSWSGRRQVLDSKRAVLGRSSDADIQIEDPNVSRRHAEVVHQGSKWWVNDLGSTNGVEINRKRVRRAELADGTSFVIGETTVTFTTERE